MHANFTGIIKKSFCRYLVNLPLPVPDREVNPDGFFPFPWGGPLEIKAGTEGIDLGHLDIHLVPFKLVSLPLRLSL